MTIILIRHVKKEYKNGKGKEGSKQHDPGILKNAIPDIKKMVNRTVELYGKPKHIITSPYKRCRETSSVIQTELIKSHSVYLNDSKNINAREYLGWQKPRDKYADVEDETKKYFHDRLGTETLEECKERSLKLIEDVKDLEGNVWIITHGIIIDFILSNTRDTSSAGIMRVRI